MFLRGCCDDCNSLSGLGAGGSVVSGRTCPDGTYLNVFQVQSGAQCPQPAPVQSTPVAPAPVAPSAPAPSAPSAPAAPTPTISTPTAPAVRNYHYNPPPVVQREIYVPQIAQDYDSGPQFETMKVSAAGAGVQLAPVGSDTGGGGGSGGEVLTTETESSTVTPAKFPWWLVAIASAVFLNN